MRFTPTVDDLRLICAVHRRGSIGAAARELLIAQPSASARLATIERRLGVALFDRDTTGARATDAGRAFADEAAHVLAHLEQLPDRVRTGARSSLLRIATFPSLAALLFPALDDSLGTLGEEVGVHQYVDHGDALIDLVAEGSLDAAVIAIADQLPLPASTTATRLGSDRLVLLTPAAASVRHGRRPFDGVVPYHCVDMNGPSIARRISELGGRPRLCATGEVAVVTARRTGRPALLAGSIAALYRHADEHIAPPPFAMDFTFHLVTRTPPPAVITGVVDDLARRMNLTV